MRYDASWGGKESHLTVMPVDGGGWVLFNSENEPVSLFNSQQSAIDFARREALHYNLWIIVENEVRIADADINWAAYRPLETR